MTSTMTTEQRRKQSYRETEEEIIVFGKKERNAKTDRKK